MQVPELFVNARGQQMTRWGFAYILRNAARVARKTHPEFPTKRISPHVLRHSVAILALNATQDIRKVSLWLGHTSTQTTEVYTRVDPAEKLESINKLAPPKIKPGRFRPPDKLLDMLKRQTLWGARPVGSPDSAGSRHTDSP
jgi:site-specific recombinase XerD